MSSRAILRSTIVFAALVVAGTLIAALAPDLADTRHAGLLSDVGSALIAGGLAFFLVEMSAWDRSRRNAVDGRRL